MAENFLLHNQIEVESKCTYSIKIPEQKINQVKELKENRANNKVYFNYNRLIERINTRRYELIKTLNEIFDGLINEIEFD